MGSAAAWGAKDAINDAFPDVEEVRRLEGPAWWKQQPQSDED